MEVQSVLNRASTTGMKGWRQPDSSLTWIVRVCTGLVEGLVQVRIFAKTQPNLTSYGWQFEISHRNKVLQLSTIAREVRLGFRKDSDLNQTLNQPSVNTGLACLSDRQRGLDEGQKILQMLTWTICWL